MPDEPSLELPSLFRRKRKSAPVEGTPRGALLTPLPAAVLTGAVVGLVLAGVVWLALRGCSGLRGTSTCGDPGILVLLAIFVVMVLASRVLLGFFRVPDAGSTAFLALALVSVVALLFVSDLASTTGVAVLAVVTALAFGLSQRLTSSFTEPGERPR
jgi:hypothetical protein